MRPGWRILAPLLFAVACASGVARADDPETEARNHFKTGVAYLQDPDGERYEEAYSEFKIAYELTHAARVLGNLGLCAMKLERDGEAIDAFSRYLAEVTDIHPEERAQVEKDLGALRQSVAHVTFEVHEQGAAIHDTRLVGRGPTIANAYDTRPGKNEFRLRPGRHLFVLRVAGNERARWEVSIVPGSSVAHDFVAPVERPRAPPAAVAPNTTRAPSPVPPLVVTGVGAATLLTATVFGFVTLGKIDDLESKCPGGACPPDSFANDVSSTRTFVRTTDILFLVGGIVTAAGLGWLIFSNSAAAPRRGAASTGVGAFAPKAQGLF
jgi:hypothetical protein